MANQAIIDLLSKNGIVARQENNEKYSWNDSYESVQMLTDEDGQEYEESWSGDQYYINNGVVVSTESDYFKAAEILGCEKEDAESLLRQWMQFHGPEEGYPVSVKSNWQADVESEDGEEKTIEDPQCTVDGTGRFSLI